jgi:uncharacterized protein YukE
MKTMILILEIKGRLRTVTTLQASLDALLSGDHLEASKIVQKQMLSEVTELNEKFTELDQLLSSIAATNEAVANITSTPPAVVENIPAPLPVQA